VLKKKNNQLSFLHCYHHCLMASTMYIAVRWVPGGSGTLLGIVNSFIHTCMYLYYFLTSFKPEMKQSLWWKKHITQLQMVSLQLTFRLTQLISFHSQTDSICYSNNHVRTRRVGCKLRLSKVLDVDVADTKHLHACDVCRLLPKSIFTEEARLEITKTTRHDLLSFP